MLSSMNKPDLVHYADSHKWGARNVKGERVLMARQESVLDYWDGED